MFLSPFAVPPTDDGALSICLQSLCLGQALIIQEKCLQMLKCCWVDQSSVHCSSDLGEYLPVQELHAVGAGTRDGSSSGGTADDCSTGTADCCSTEIGDLNRYLPDCRLKGRTNYWSSTSWESEIFNWEPEEWVTWMDKGKPETYFGLRWLVHRWGTRKDWRQLCDTGKWSLFRAEWLLGVCILPLYVNTFLLWNNSIRFQFGKILFSPFLAPYTSNLYNPLFNVDIHFFIVN